MKKSILIIIAISFLTSCVEKKPDKRDKYVGEYLLYENYERWGEREGTKWDYHTQSYERERYHQGPEDLENRGISLVVKKSPYDTISLIFDVIRPFNFERAERIKKENEQIKKRNEESICGEDEKLHEVPKPTYSNDRDLVESYRGYVKGHKLFIREYNEHDRYDGEVLRVRYETRVKFDSVYLRNDTLFFQKFSRYEYYSNDKLSYWECAKSKYYGVKVENE